MSFWKLAWEYKWVTLEQFKLVVKTESNKFGDITPEQFKEIAGVEFVA